MTEPFINDPDFVLYVGDVRDVLATLPDESVHCVVTSPPYWGLRDYSVNGQLGLEATPDLYVENMVAVFREVRRVLRRDGTCWLNLGDSYAANAPGNVNAPNATGISGRGERRYVRGMGEFKARGLKPKDLVGVPWRVAFALQADGWYLRADVIWSKPNPMPESVSDRPTKAHEYLFLLTRSPRYFYDADAIREPAEYGRREWGPGREMYDAGTNGFRVRGGVTGANPEAGRNRRSVWEIATEPYPDAHFATFPQGLVEPCVKAGTSERGCCPVCGAPWEREVERPARPNVHRGKRDGDGDRAVGGVYQKWLDENPPVTTGWRPTCDCGDEQGVIGQVGTVAPEPVPCTVLDPFMGSGTTALVARRLGRRSIGVELNETYAGLAARRLAQLSLLA